MKKLFLTLILVLFVIPFGMSQELPSYVPTGGLAAFYTFDGNANDSSSNSNHGIVNGPNLSDDRNSKQNSSYFFDGTDDYINMGLDNSLKIQNQFSASVWFKHMGGLYDNCNPRIFEAKDVSGGSGGYALALSKGTQLHLAYYGPVSSENGFFYIDDFVDLNSWTHVAFSVDGINLEAKIYVNGQLYSSKPINSFENISYEGELIIGNIDPSRCDWFRGNIDELGLWNRILTEQEIQNLYTSSTGDILFNGVVSAENNQIKNVADPTHAQDAATKAYIDSLISDLQEQIDALQSTSDSAKAPMLAVPGQYQGWNPGGAPLLAASAAGQTDFEGFIYMDIDEANNNGFKFVEGVDEVYEWGNPDWGQSKTGAQGTLAISDEDNVTVDADGLYYLQVDPALGTYSTTLMSLGLIGDATPTGWDSDTDFVYDATNNVLTLDINLSNGGEYKIRANNGWDIGFPGQFGADSDGDGFLDSRQGMWVHENATGNYRITLDVFTARKYTLTVTAL